MNIDFDGSSEKDWNKEMVTIAIGKGRGFEESLRFVEVEHSSTYQAFASGIVPVYVDKKNNINLVKTRNKDLPWLLSRGYIDIAIGSSVWFDEFLHPSLKVVTDLPVMKCRLSVIAAKQMQIKEITGICTKFTALAEQYIVENELRAKLLLMEGCHEVALSLGMTDAIIDIIETGKTIERMNFIELDCIREVTHGIWTREKDRALIGKLNAGFLRQLV
jgi:ATP phosphoribosyltransferase